VAELSEPTGLSSWTGVFTKNIDFCSKNYIFPAQWLQILLCRVCRPVGC